MIVSPIRFVKFLDGEKGYETIQVICDNCGQEFFGSLSDMTEQKVSDKEYKHTIHHEIGFKCKFCQEFVFFFYETDSQKEKRDKVKKDKSPNKKKVEDFLGIEYANQLRRNFRDMQEILATGDIFSDPERKINK